MTTILDFLKNGKLGPVSLGDTKDKVEAILGKPDDTSISRKPQVLKYGCIQLSFYWDKELKASSLNSIHLYFDNKNIVFPASLCMEGWIPNNQIKHYDFLERCKESEISIEKYEQLTFANSQTSYKSIANVIIVFDTEANSDNLVSMHITKR